MPVSLRRGRVTAILEEHDGLVRLEVDGEACVAYPGLTGAVVVEDEVLVNVQARELELGSGGFDVLYANLTRGVDLSAPEGAHVMKLPYTPLQAAAAHAEEGSALTEELTGLPVVCCSLHSQVAPACAGLGEGLRVAYVQLPGGALPLPLSDTVRLLREKGVLATTVSAGACFGGEEECVGVASALAWAAGEGYDAVLCAIGPGSGGRRSTWAAGRRPARACRCPTWGAAPLTSHGSSRPRSPPGASRAVSSLDGVTAVRPRRRARNVEHVRR